MLDSEALVERQKSEENACVAPAESRLCFQQVWLCVIMKLFMNIQISIKNHSLSEATAARVSKGSS